MAEPTTAWQHYAYAATAPDGQVLAAVTGGGSLADLVRVDRTDGHTEIRPFAADGRVRVVGDLEVTGDAIGRFRVWTEAPPETLDAWGTSLAARFYRHSTGGAPSDAPVQARGMGMYLAEGNFRAVLHFVSNTDRAFFRGGGGWQEIVSRTNLTGLPTSSPGGSGNLWRDSNGFLRVT